MCTLGKYSTQGAYLFTCLSGVACVLFKWEIYEDKFCHRLFVLECLSFTKCCSGAKQTIDTASGEMKGRVTIHICVPAHMYAEGESP